MRAEPRLALWQKQEDDLVTALLQASHQDLIEAEWAQARSHHEDVRVIVARVQSRLAKNSDPRLAPAGARRTAASEGDDRPRGAGRPGRVQARFRRFVELRDEAALSGYDPVW